jgi:WhiB family redox-sensing transcriptional regulator
VNVIAAGADEETAWAADAACATADSRWFYPGRGEDIAPALMYCAACPVAGDCLEYALAHGEIFGIWGGTSERERRRIRRARVGAQRVTTCGDCGAVIVRAGAASSVPRFCGDACRDRYLAAASPYDRARVKTREARNART